MAATDDLTAVSVLPILVVDDRQDNLHALDGVLEPLGYPLPWRARGTRRCGCCSSTTSRLILLDVRMPELDGLETAQLIKGRARTRDVPIVFLTAANDDIGDVLRGYGVGAVDYVLKPFDPEVLRSKVAVFAELEKNRRALKRSETFLRAAFEAAPIGKTMLDGERAIVRSNTAFARLVGREPAELEGVQILDLCHPEDRDRRVGRVRSRGGGDVRPDSSPARASTCGACTACGTEVWVGLVASSIEPADLSTPLLLAQWVDLSSRRRAEEARAELLMEHAARTHAEAMAERLSKLQALSGAIDSLSLHRVLAELAVAPWQSCSMPRPPRSRSSATQASPSPSAPSMERRSRQDPGKPRAALENVHEVPIVIEGTQAGVLRMRLPTGRSYTSAERSLMQDAAERAALGIRRAQLHEREHQVAVELQRGLLPKQLPAIAGLELAAHYEAAGARGGRRLVRRVRAARRQAGSGAGGRRGQGRAGRVGDGAAAQRDARVRACRRRHSSRPAEMLTRLNRHQLALGQTELFTVVYAIIDPAEGTISWSTAGHPPPLAANRRGWPTYLEGGEGLMGIEDIVYRDLRAPLEAESIVIFYTDGLIERRGESLDVGLERLADALGSGLDDPSGAVRVRDRADAPGGAASCTTTSRRCW